MENRKRCPYCGEEIMTDAKKCRYCGEWLDDKVKLERDAIAGSKSLVEPFDAKPNKTNKVLTIILAIAIVIALALVGLLLPKLRGLSNDKTKAVYDERKEIIEKQVVEAYNNGTIFELVTPAFLAAEEAAMEAQAKSGEMFFDAVLFYNTQDVVPDSVKVSEVNLLGNDTALVKVILSFKDIMNQWTENIDLIMVKEGQISDLKSAKWLFDDIVSLSEDGKTVSYSTKADMLSFANSIMEELDYEDVSFYEEKEMEDETTLNLKNVSYDCYNNSRFGFSVLYPTFFKRKYESYNQDGCSFYYGNNYSMVAYGMYNESSIKDCFETRKRSTDTYSICKGNWFVVSGFNEDGNIYYVKTILENGVEYTLELKYPQDKKKDYEAILNKVINSLDYYGDIFSRIEYEE